jgi:NADH:ubiquinone oxidoreductase subunit 4 (subunit M)
LLVNTIYNFWFFNKVFFGTLKKKKKNISIIKSVNFTRLKIKPATYQDVTQREFITLLILAIWLIIWGIFPEKLINFCQIHLIYLNIRSLT